MYVAYPDTQIGKHVVPATDVVLQLLRLLGVGKSEEI